MRGPFLIALSAAALLLSGCGGGEAGGPEVASVAGGGNSAPASAKPSEDPHERALKYAQCMRENGVDMEDPQPGKGIVMKITGQNRETVEKAQEACKQYAPSGQRSGQGDSKRGEKLRKLAQCMRDNGVESYPDPEGNTMRINAEVAQDPDFEAAQKKCRQEAADAGMGEA